MLLRHLGTILPAQKESKKRDTAIAWSPDNLKLAVTSSDCMVHLFDDKCTKKDEFSTKALNARNHTIKGLSFSPDSARLAVGHTDGFVKVYNISEEWGKRSVEFELHQGSSVTCLAWPSDELIVVGLENGKVNAIATTTRIVTILCDTSSTTVSLAINSRGTGMLSSHADGKINRYHITETGMIELAGLATVHPVGAQALAWTHHNHILAGGRDRRLAFYDSRGKPHQIFSYCGNQTAAEGIAVACCAPSGQNVAIGTWDGMRILNLSPRTTLWEDGALTTLPKNAAVIAIAWRRDGSQLIVAGGSDVEQYEVSLRSPSTFGTIGYEVLYVEPSLAIVSSLGDERSKPIVVRSRACHEIEDVKLLGNHVIARTAATLIICELNSDLVSEIPRENEKDVLAAKELCWGEKPRQAATSSQQQQQQQQQQVSFDVEQEQQRKRNDSKAKSKSSRETNDSDNNSLSSSGLCEMRNKLENSANLRKEKCKDGKAIINRRANNTNLVYSTTSAAKSADGYSRASSSLRSNASDKLRKGCKSYTAEDSVCWTMSSENETTTTTTAADVQQKKSRALSTTGSDAYKPWTGGSSSLSSTPDIPLPGLAAASPIIRFTRQYTPEELRGDFSLQLAVMASLSPGLQRVLEKQAMTDEKD